MFECKELLKEIEIACKELEDCDSSVLTEDQLDDIDELRCAGMRLHDLAEIVVEEREG